METLICAQCKRELSVDNFSPRKDTKRGYKSWCKTCRKEEHREYREKNHDKLLKKEKEYREENREAIRERRRNFTDANKEKIREKQRKRYSENVEKERNRLRIYRKKHPDRIRVTQKKFKEKDNDKFHEKYAVYAQIRTARKRQLPSTYTSEQWIEAKHYFGETCCYCGKKKRLTQDHFLALSRGGAYTKENIVPACGICNSSKKESLFEEWYPQQDFYSILREEKIIQYLNSMKTLNK